MEIIGKNIGKKYGRSWIFRNLDIEIRHASKVAITGKNGAGKSTLLQILSGYLTPTEGQVYPGSHERDSTERNQIYLGPYTEIIEEMTLLEFLGFHSNFKRAKVGAKEMATRASLPLDRFISDFSTGMKQRVKLITAFYFASEIVFMDEPTSNLDQDGFDWWEEELKNLNQTVIIATNDPREIKYCPQLIKL